MGRRSEVALWQTVLTALLWGTSFPVISQGIRGGLSPTTFAFLRFTLAAPLMLVAVWILKRDVATLVKRREVWIIAALNAIGFLCQFVGQQYTGASVAALLVNLSVVVAAAGAAAFLGERFGPLKIVGVLFAALGAALIATNGNLSALTSGQMAGDSLYLVAAVTWAAYILYAKKVTDELQWDPLAASASIVGITAVMLLPAAALAGGASSYGTSSLEVIVYTAVVNTAIPFFLFQSGLKYLTAASSAVVLMLEIVVAMGISAAFLGEVLSSAAWVGAVMVLVSILLVSGIELGAKGLSGVSDGGEHADGRNDV